MAARIRKSDTIEVLSGRDRGKRGTVERVIPRERRVVVEGINIRKRHTRARRPGAPQGIIEFPAPLHISNVAVVCEPCDRPVRVGFRFLADGSKVRFCRRCDEVIAMVEARPRGTVQADDAEAEA
ncbi:MAG: 50S ribosomal protein L24 [Chloroflexota bacterium]|nr:50S ribosomal protein L24 [Chloroflexota bacterium]